MMLKCLVAPSPGRLFCTVGVHPTRCSEFEEHPEGSEAYMAALLDVILEGQHLGKVVAIGEMGLDYDRCYPGLDATNRFASCACA